MERCSSYCPSDDVSKLLFPDLPQIAQYNKFAPEVAVADRETNQILAQRAEILLHRLRFPDLPQIALDKNKIQYN
ncbi:rop guanine nucleotide exchange factor 1 [Phtheirospermum japonicum]|uniref:Rop guanine nucleotide exchange factor 1 n=1 Tax=Phtheirospermum japonicum TaxID=374723 RepID=A0A830CRJ1_9LAMI|nr:rop guanine nucleotide exchange factor 1 [Phtheirospermum japonicum]